MLVEKTNSKLCLYILSQQPKSSRSQMCVVKNLPKFRGKQLTRSSFLIKIYLEETPAQVLSCEFHQILKSTFFIEHLRTTASDNQKSRIKENVKKYLLKTLSTCIKFSWNTSLINFIFTSKLNFASTVTVFYSIQGFWKCLKK